MRLRLLLVALALLSAVWAVPALAAPNDGTVTGQVLNKTSGGGSTAGATVILVTFGRNEQKPLGQQTTQADASGHYTFSGLDRDPNLVYLTVARYGSVNYPSDAPFQLQDQPSQQADISVYDTTSSDGAIQLDNLNLLILGADQGVLQLMEMGALVNNGDRTFITEDPQDQQLAHGIKFALPSGAVNVHMQAGFNDQDVIAGVGGVQVTSPVPPGRHQFALSFQVPYTGSSADLSLQVPYPAATFNVYLPDTGMKLDASGLSSSGSTQMGGQAYTLYTASNVGAATMLSAQLSGLASTGAIGPNQLALISLGVVLLVLGGGVVVFGMRRRAPAAAAAAESEPEDSPEPEYAHERLELVVRLAALDERYAAGEVDSDEYAAERQRGKQRLLELALAERQAV